MTVKLSKTELEVGRLYFEEKLSPKQIAELLNISINTVYKAISKYRAYMREKGIDPDKIAQTKRQEREHVQENKASSLQEQLCEQQKQVEQSSEVAQQTQSIQTSRTETQQMQSTSSAGTVIGAYTQPVIKYCLTLQAHIGSAVSLHSSAKQDNLAGIVVPPEYAKYFEAIVTTLSTLCDYMSKLVDLLSSVSTSLRELLSLAKTGSVVINGAMMSNNVQSASIHMSQSYSTSSASSELPEFLRDNVWVDIIRSKFSTA